MVNNNNFNRDSHSIRSERLRIIQYNFASLQPILAAPSHIEAWATDCYDIYIEIMNKAGIESAVKTGKTMLATSKGKLMEKEYQFARVLGKSLYADNSPILKDYDFDTAFPTSQSDKIARVEYVLAAYERHILEGVTPLLPSGIITRLTNAKAEYVEALKEQDKQESESRKDFANLKERFAADTLKLQMLRAWWFAMLGKKDTRIMLIGMVNPQSGGRKRKVKSVDEQSV